MAVQSAGREAKHCEVKDGLGMSSSMAVADSFGSIFGGAAAATADAARLNQQGNVTAHTAREDESKPFI